MEIVTTQAQGRVPVTVLQPQGDLDAATYQELIACARAEWDAGARDLLLDLSGVPYVSSSGLVALHAIALLARGAELPDSESGWDALRGIKRDLGQGIQPHVKLLNPQPRVHNVLQMVGFNQIFEIFTDQEAAVASF